MTKLRFFNTFSASVEDFIPIETGKVKMYVCGITPYDKSHLGHARCYVVFDSIRRFLEYSGYEVDYIQNFTDIDDKIIQKAHSTNSTPLDISNKYIEDFLLNCKNLNIKPAKIYPKVTEHISEIIETIKTLVSKGFAYESDGDVYFSVKKFTNYGKLSKRNIEELIVGARVASGEKKHDPLDFALWKNSKPEEPFWESPWGKGRPGWHIECSSMSMHEINRETLDIHGGGQDLIFPHHENEIAQSEASTGKPFAKYWIHNGFVTINKEKMSKSLGNFFALDDIFAKFDPMVVRLFLLSQHYRTPLDFSDSKLYQSKNTWDRIKGAKQIAETLINILSESNINEKNKNYADMLSTNFSDCLNNDFNTSEAFAVIHNIANTLYSFEQDKSNEINRKTVEYYLSKLIETCNVLGLVFPDNQTNLQLQDLVTQREIARKNKDFKKADSIRKEIDLLGYTVEDTPHGPRTKHK